MLRKRTQGGDGERSCAGQGPGLGAWGFSLCTGLLLLLLNDSRTWEKYGSLHTLEMLRASPGPWQGGFRLAGGDGNACLPAGDDSSHKACARCPVVLIKPR